MKEFIKLNLSLDGIIENLGFLAFFVLIIPFFIVVILFGFLINIFTFLFRVDDIEEFIVGRHSI